MYEDMTYEALLKSALNRVPSQLDRREGSVIMNAVAPAMAELAQLYIGLDFVLNATYLSTAPREYLILRAADRGMTPYPASPAVFRGEFDAEVPEGSRFSCDDLYFTVTGRLDPAEDAPGALGYRLVCETPGAAASAYRGQLVPVAYIDGLTQARLTGLLIPGEDEEETETFRSRVLNSLQSQSFGGNQADYREKVLAIPGVAAVKVQPVWNGGISPAALIPGETVHSWYEGTVEDLGEDVAAWLTAVYTAAKERKLTVGGTVSLTVMAAGNTVPSSELLESVQTAVDPTQNAGEGLGLAPIGHVVHVTGVEQTRVDVGLNLSFVQGWDWESARSHVLAVIDGYFEELAGAWAGSDFLTVRISQIESRILSACAGIVEDIGGTTLNGTAANLALDSAHIPVRGEVSG